MATRKPPARSASKSKAPARSAKGKPFGGRQAPPFGKKSSAKKAPSKSSSKSRGGTAFGPKGTKVPKTYAGKSTKLGQGGRAAKMKAAGVPGGVIGERARAKGAAPGQRNYH